MWRTSRGCTQSFWNHSYCDDSLGYLAAICLLPTLNHRNMFLLFTFCSFHINFQLFVSLMVHLSKPGVTARGDKTFFRGGIWHLMPPRQITTHSPGNTFDWSFDLILIHTRPGFPVHFCAFYHWAWTTNPKWHLCLWSLGLLITQFWHLDNIFS